MIEQLAYLYLETLINSPVVKGACLNVGLGFGYSARLMLGFRPVTRVSTLEITQATIDAYRVRWPADEALETRHTIVQGDAANPTPGMVTALNPPFDFVFIDTIQNADDADYQAIRSILTAATNGLLKAGGGICVNWIKDNYHEREARVWVDQRFNRSVVRPALAPTGRARAAAMEILTPKP